MYTHTRRERGKVREREIPILCNFSHHLLIIMTIYKLILSVNLTFKQNVLAHVSIALYMYACTTCEERLAWTFNL